MSAPSTPPLRRDRRRVVTTVHERRGSDPGALDAMLALAEPALAAAPLDEVLAALAPRLARALAVEVCSIYLRDEEDTLVLAATHGFPASAVGQVRMRVGEGLTGFAVECLRPVTVAALRGDTRNKRFASLHEERFPSFCALPLVDGRRAVGALVVQRREARTFSRRELALVAAVAPVVLLALERAARREAERSSAPAAAPRSTSLLVRGAGAVPGLATGHLSILGTPRSRPDARAADAAREAERLEAAFSRASADAARLEAWALGRLARGEAAPDEVRRGARVAALAMRSLADDARLRERALSHAAAGATAESAVERVAREYGRVLGASDDEALRERAGEVEALAARLLDALAGRAHGTGPGRVLAAARLSVFDAVDAASRHASAFVLTDQADASPGIAVARALGLPVVCGLPSLARWAHDGDRVLIDGDRGTVAVNPPRSEVAAMRGARKTRKPREA